MKLDYDRKEPYLYDKHYLIIPKNLTFGDKHQKRRFDMTKYQFLICSKTHYAYIPPTRHRTPMAAYQRYKEIYRLGYDCITVLNKEGKQIDEEQLKELIHAVT